MKQRRSLPQFAWRLRRWVTRSAVERELTEEIRFHIDQQTTKNLRAGMSPEQARRAALMKFGGVEQMKEATRDEFRAAVIEDFGRDLRYGARVLARSPGFACIAVLTLGLGIGAATAVFSVVYGVLLQPLPYPAPDRIVRLYQVDGDGRRMNVSEPNFEDWKAGTRSFRVMAETAAGSSPVSVNGEPAMSTVAMVSKEFFDVMGVRPANGRVFSAEELRVGGTPAVIVSHAFWSRRLNGVSLVPPPSVKIQDTLHSVIGVMPPGFDFPARSDFWIPRELNPPQTSRTAHNFNVIARLADGVALQQAGAELSSVSRALKSRYGDQTWMSDAQAIELREQLTAATRPVLLMLFAAALLLLAIACLNVSNLQLARASTRQRELAVRLALGADRGRITRQLLAEALVLGAAAGSVGVAIAIAGVRALTALQPANLPRISDVHVSATVLAFGIAVAVITAGVLGVVTSFRVSHRQLRDTLSEGTRTMAGGRSERVRQGLVVTQVALTIVLLVGAGLLTRSMMAVLDVDSGFKLSTSVILDLVWSGSRDGDARYRRLAAQEEVVRRLAALPGAQGAGFISSFPLGAAFYPNGQFFEMTRPDEFQTYADVASLGEAAAKARAGFAGFRVASEGYFKAMGIPLRRGRLFEEADGPDAPHVAVISESLAQTKWPNQDPIGRFIQFGNMDGDRRAFRIVGIVGDVREVSPEAVPSPLFYGSHRQRLVGRASVVVPTSSVAAYLSPARQTLREIEPEMPVLVRTFEESVDRALAGRRFSLLLIGVFSVVALVLATLGIYGLMAYLVAERTREIGIRMALGAESTDVTRLIVGKGATLALVGAVAGLGAALGLSRFLEGMLFGVQPTDPIAFAAVIIVTMVSVMIASYVPARRALRVAPVVALRSE